jgi:anti-sigma factor RsiW
VRCSSCEPLLDRYVEGTLPPRRMALVKAHVQSCARCESLVTELRVVDALLSTTKPVELAPNFTFAVMAEARATPIHPKRSLPVWGALALYVVAAWIAVSGIYAALGGRLPYVGAMRDAFATAGTQTVAAIAGTAQGFEPATPFVVGVVFGVLLVDALLVIGTIYFYRAARSRLAAQPQPSEAI